MGGNPRTHDGLNGCERMQRTNRHITGLSVTDQTTGPPSLRTDLPISPLLPPPAMKGAMAVHPDTSDEGANRYTNVMT